ncbi:MAG: hypothetical protein PQJ59_01615 [Spirochaetales bacterium]|nr:hypothetical protein [Spirochaetales bacterium]
MDNSPGTFPTHEENEAALKEFAKLPHVATLIYKTGNTTVTLDIKVEGEDLGDIFEAHNELVRPLVEKYKMVGGRDIGPVMDEKNLKGEIHEDL